MAMAKVTATQMDRLNLNLMFNALPIGSEIETGKGKGTITGIVSFKGELVFRVLINKENGKNISGPMKAADLGIQLITDPDNLAEISKAAGEVIEAVSEMLPPGVETKVEAVAPFEFSGKKLKEMRQARGFTQVFVAEYLGMAKSSSAAIGDWEAERNRVPVKHQTKLIDLYTPKDEEIIEEEEMDEEVVEDETSTIYEALAAEEANQEEADEAANEVGEEEEADKVADEAAEEEGK